VVEKLVNLSSSLWGEIVALWLGTFVIVAIASLVHYFAATNRRQKLAKKYRDRSPDTDEQVFIDWRASAHRQSSSHRPSQRQR
jgi:hypothetical protein